METKEFKVGDRVENDDTEYAGIITAVDDLGCDVRFDDGEKVWILKDLLRHSDEPKYDPKTAFLRDLSELLRRYDASFRAEIIGFEGMLPTMSFMIGNEQFYLPEQGYITADNVLNYDK